MGDASLRAVVDFRAPVGDPVEGALVDLLDRHPNALVAAVAWPGPGVFVPLPDSLDFVRRRVSSEPDPELDIAIDADRVAALRIWTQARLQRIAVGRVRIRRFPEQPGYLHILDLTARHGVTVLVFVLGASDPGPQPRVLPVPRAARFARVSKDEGGTIRWFDPEFAQMLGRAQDEIVGHRIVEFVHPEDREAGIKNWMSMLDEPRSTRRHRVRYLRRDGSSMWVEVTNHNRLDGDDGDVLSEVLDVSEEMAAHEALLAREQLLAQLTDAVPVGLFHVDREGRVRFANRRLEEVSGVEQAATLDEQLAAVIGEDRRRLDEAIAAVLSGSEADLEISISNRAAAVRFCALSLRPMHDDAGAITGLTGCLTDVTEMVRSRHDLEKRAASDPLTGSLNRSATLAVLADRLESPVGGSVRGTAVIFMDLDGFKPINDRYGHAIGDELLVTLAARIASSLRSDDVVGRFGGDEFLIVCSEVPGPEEALEIARALNAEVRRPFTVGSVDDLHLRASFGVVWTASRTVAVDRLVRAADEAMYVSKRSRRGEPMLAHVPEG